MSTTQAFDSDERWVRLGESRVALCGTVPQPGDRLIADFVIPAARGTTVPLSSSMLQSGVILLSTLPNIHKHSCALQIAHLDEQAPEVLPRVQIVHVSSDPVEHWKEVDLYHGQVRATGYTLHGADSDSRRAFVSAFGVGVVGHHRVAHGLFSLHDGMFGAVEIPDDQMGIPFVEGFLRRVVSWMNVSKQ